MHSFRLLNASALMVNLGPLTPVSVPLELAQTFCCFLREDHSRNLTSAPSHHLAAEVETPTYDDGFVPIRFSGATALFGRSNSMTLAG